ncbi:hypothetical protein FRC12_024965 [Ceratobasidium sp. 428]|nr:hypothetical protein FRC12_024965 [Ceratobasidium sp. 428]
MCRAARDWLGVLGNYAPRRTHETAEAIRNGSDIDLNSVTLLYWATLPFVQLDTLFPPNILHQLLNGMFKDHIFTWCRTAIGNDEELDRRFRALPPFPGLKHFRNGVTRISQWTGNESRSMIRVFLGVIIDAPNITHNTVLAVRAFLDFVFTCQFEYHDGVSLHTLEEALKLFHSLKEEFIRIGGRKLSAPAEMPEFENEEEPELEDSSTSDAEWIIPKLHGMSHYVPQSKTLGAPSHFSTDQPEHMHIHAAKQLYQMSNRCDYMPQIVDRLDMNGRVRECDEYFKWRQHDQSLPNMNIDDHQTDDESKSEADSSDQESVDGGNGIAANSEDEPSNQAADIQEEDQFEDEYEPNQEETHQFPKNPSRKNIPLQQITQEHHAEDLYRQLQLYYHRCSDRTNTSRHQSVRYELPPLPFTHVSLYKQFQIKVPAPPYTPGQDIQLTVKASPQGGKKV